MRAQVTLIPGDGIGPAITTATVRILEATGAEIEWDVQVAGMAAVAKYGDPIPDSTLDSIKRTRCALKGPLETPVGEGYRSIHVALRKTCDPRTPSFRGVATTTSTWCSSAKTPRGCTSVSSTTSRSATIRERRRSPL